MAYSNRFRSVLNDNFKILTWVLILFIAITPNFIFIHSANASAAEKWTIEEVVYNDIGKTLSYTAEKNYGSAANDYKYKAKVPVTASVAGSTALSMIRMGLAGAALYGLVEGVGWIIENGIVKKIDPSEPSIPPTQYYYSLQVGATNFTGTPDSIWNGAFETYWSKQTGNAKPNPDIAHTKTIKGTLYNLPVYNYCYTNMGGYKYCVDIAPRPNPNYDPDYQPQYVPVSPSEMGNEIIDSPAAPQLLPDIYSPNNPVPRPSPAPDAVETALDNAPPIPKTDPKGDSNNKPNKDTDGDGEPDIYDPALPDNGSEFKLPPACEWFPVVCEWYVEYKQDVKKAEAHAQETKDFWQTVKDWFDWTKDIPDDLESGEVTIHQDSNIIFDDSQRINFSSSCPSPEQFSVSFFGASQNLEFSYQPLCNFMSMIKPFVIAGSYLIGAYIVMGLSRGSGD